MLVCLFVTIRSCAKTVRDMRDTAIITMSMIEYQIMENQGEPVATTLPWNSALKTMEQARQSVEAAKVPISDNKPRATRRW